jgi:hypothetical protein
MTAFPLVQKPLTYLLVDFENVKPSATEVARVRGDEFRLCIFRGPHQNKFDADMVEAWQPLGEHVRFVQSVKAGKNALDFHIAFCLGLVHRDNAASQRPARYIVVSKDGGFDALFEYARAERCYVMKAATIDDALSIAALVDPIRFLPSGLPTNITPLHADSPKPPPPSVADSSKQPSPPAKAAKTTVKERATVNADDVEKVTTHLREHPKSRPTKQAKLEHHVLHILGKGVTEKVARAVVDHLIRDKLITIVNSKIEYKLSKNKR